MKKKKDFIVLKNVYGEKFAQLCDSLFSAHMGDDCKVSNFILKTFAPSRFLYDDIVNNFVVFDEKDVNASLKMEDVGTFVFKAFVEDNILNAKDIKYNA